MHIGNSRIEPAIRGAVKEYKDNGMKSKNAVATIFLDLTRRSNCNFGLLEIKFKEIYEESKPSEIQKSAAENFLGIIKKEIEQSIRSYINQVDSNKLLYPTRFHY